jgi:hypothetical protein
MGAWAQQETPKIVVNVEGFRYPMIGRSAVIGGDVLFEINASGPKLLSGIPIFATPAHRNLETWTLPPLEHGRYFVRYHFVLLRESRQVMVPVGNKVDRFFLRLFHAPTQRAKTMDVCDTEASTAVRQTITKDRDNFVIDVFATSKPACAILD